MINIKGLPKAEVLVALYNKARPLGLGWLQATPNDMKVEEAEELLKHQTYFDYLHGRSMKIDLSNDELLDDRLYARDNGDGTAELEILKVRMKHATGFDKMPNIIASVKADIRNPAAVGMAKHDALKRLTEEMIEKGIIKFSEKYMGDGETVMALAGLYLYPVNEPEGPFQMMDEQSKITKEAWEAMRYRCERRNENEQACYGRDVGKV